MSPFLTEGDNRAPKVWVRVDSHDRRARRPAQVLDGLLGVPTTPWSPSSRLPECLVEDGDAAVVSVAHFHHGLLAPDVLETLAGPETDGPTRWNRELLTRAGIATDAPLARPNVEHAEPA